MLCSDVLKGLRKERGFTQKEVANHFHISASTLSNYENAIHEPPYDILLQFCDFYQVSVDYILGRTKCRLQGDGLSKVLCHTYPLWDITEFLAQLSPQNIKHFIDYLVMMSPF
jgi:transcriptional regulator with XRE-family HTH domain